MTEYPPPQFIALTEPISNLTDSPLQLPVTPTPPQIIPQPQTIESTSTELTCDNPDHDTTRTHGFKPHSMTMTDPPPPEPPQHETAISLPPQMISISPNPVAPPRTRKRSTKKLSTDKRKNH